MQSESGLADHLYVHFPFCRRKCRYCALHSRPGATRRERDAYAAALAAPARGEYATAYFGGGTPALCDLSPLLAAVSAGEFTVELHPLDVTPELMAALRDGGVNRISMGVQSLDDEVLADMGRGYTFDTAEKAFLTVKKYIDNAGIDLIVGYPGERSALTPRHGRLGAWGLRHCSVYALQNERNLAGAADDDTVMDRLAAVAGFLGGIGLARYEISNYAQPGFECRHNLAVWRGEDYLGLGEGAFGRIGRVRTPSGETLSAVEDAKERAIFRLRTRDGLDASAFPQWFDALDWHVREGLLTRAGRVYRLTRRGAEVCDAILADLV